MLRLFGKEWDKNELLRHIGNIHQVGGVKRICFEEGSGKGVSSAMFNTGAGLTFFALIDRCLDIPIAFYKGASLCWHSCTGLHRPEFFEPAGSGWLRTFFGGLMITCGLTGAGAPSEDEAGIHGLHGRATSLPAEDVSVWNTWIGDELEMGVCGTMRESAVFGDYLELRRQVIARLGVNSILIKDTVINQGYKPSPFMIIYHVNIGFPVLDDGAELLTASRRVIPRDKEAEKGLKQFNTFDSPQPDYKEQVFFHELLEDNEGFCESALVNPSFNNGEGLGVHLRWKKAQLPYFTEWKQIGEGTYTVGMEPGNCYPLGRRTEREEGRLQILQPGEEHHIELKISVLENNEQIEALRTKLQKLKSESS